jgi:hypothetical protein
MIHCRADEAPFYNYCSKKIIYFSAPSEPTTNGALIRPQSVSSGVGPRA